MCIIISKPAGVSMPPMSAIEESWKSNPHGAGFMYAADGRVHISKGFMKIEDFKAALKSLQKAHDLKKLPLVTHFRISTQAGVNAQNTHPFPISNDMHALIARSSSSFIAGIAHNGIIPCCSNYKKDEPYSDTLYFIRDYVSRLVKKSGDLQEQWMQTVLEEVSQSKLTILLPCGEIILLGEFTKEDGVSYSNGSYKKIKRSKLSFSAKTSFSRKNMGLDEWEYSSMSYASNTLASYDGDGNGYVNDFGDEQHDDPGALNACTEDMCYFDEDVCDYVSCDPETHFFDELSELWVFDEIDGSYYPTSYTVYDNELLPLITRKYAKCWEEI